jgi:uncharacterized alkaline shock family protein YloU
MKTFHLVIGTVLFLVLATGAGCFLYGALQEGSAWSTWVDIWIKGQHIHGAMAAGVIICLLLLYVLTGLNVPGKTQYLAYDNEGGAVSISLKAVEGFLARLSGEFAAVVSLQPKLRLIVNQVDVQLDIKVKAGAQIPELCKMLQEAARSTLKDKVGISDIREVRVRVGEIVVPQPPGSKAAVTEHGTGKPPVF